MQTIISRNQTQKGEQETIHPSRLSELYFLNFQAAFTTAPDLIQRVQTLVLFVFPPVSAIRTVFRLGSQRRLVLL